MVPPIVRVPRSVYRTAGNERDERAIPEETAIAFTFNTASYAVMMATPENLEDFAIGFSLTEGVVRSSDAIESVDIVEEDVGIELRIWLKAPHAAEFLGRRRKMAGPTGCGLCGIESLVEAMRPPPAVGEGRVFTPEQIMTAVEALFPLQALNHETRAVHAAGFWQPERGLVVLREDVGRHNALDKLIGSRLLAGELPLDRCLLLLSGRASFELLQKAAAAGIAAVAAIGAPSSLAIELAERTGILLIGFLREQTFNVYAHPERLQ